MIRHATLSAIIYRSNLTGTTEATTLEPGKCREEKILAHFWGCHGEVNG